MYPTKTHKGWRFATSATLTDEQAAALTFHADPEHVLLGEYVEVEDAEGIRIGHVVSAHYHRQAFGPSYVVCRIDLL